jgi:hypothetical protein
MPKKKNFVNKMEKCSKKFLRNKKPTKFKSSVKFVSKIISDTILRKIQTRASEIEILEK